jgi:hypothetical protein
MEKFFIFMFNFGGSPILKEVEGVLIEKYGIKAFIHKSEGETIQRYAITEYSTGMNISNASTYNKAVELFEEIFNNPSLTEFGKEDKLRSVKEIIESNIERYGYANV